MDWLEEAEDTVKKMFGWISLRELHRSSLYTCHTYCTSHIFWTNPLRHISFILSTSFALIMNLIISDWSSAKKMAESQLAACPASLLLSRFSALVSPSLSWLTDSPGPSNFSFIFCFTLTPSATVQLSRVSLTLHHVWDSEEWFVGWLMSCTTSPLFYFVSKVRHK